MLHCSGAVNFKNFYSGSNAACDWIEKIVKFVQPGSHVRRHVTKHQRQKRTLPFDVTF